MTSARLAEALLRSPSAARSHRAVTRRGAVLESTRPAYACVWLRSR
jgi:hypothetical protein